MWGTCIEQATTVDMLDKTLKNTVKITSNAAASNRGWPDGVSGPGMMGMPSKMWKGAADSKTNAGTLRCGDGEE